MYNVMKKECTKCYEWDNYRIIGEKMSGKERHLYLLHCALFEIAPLGRTLFYIACSLFLMWVAAFPIFSSER